MSDSAPIERGAAGGTPPPTRTIARPDAATPHPSDPGSAAAARTVQTGPIGLHAVRSQDATAAALGLIQTRLDDGAATTDIAVLARVNSALLPIQVALTQSRIPHTAPLDASVLGRTGVRTALAYLRIGLDTDRIRRDDLFDTINRPARKVRSAVTPLLKRSGARFSIRHLEQVADALDGVHQERFAGYLGDLRHLERAITDGADTARCLWIVRNRIGLGEAMDALDASRTRPEGSSHGDDLDALEQLAELQPDPAAFREWLTDRLRVPGDPGGVTLSTVHRVKGMEWDHVVVVGANQGAFPHRLADDVEEERRVFHVAVTRCRERVDVVSDRDRTSPFVAELTRAADPRPDRPPVDRAPLPDPSDPAFDDDGRVVAATGLDLHLAGGFTARVVEVADTHAVVALTAPATGRDGDARQLLHVAFGSPVTVDGGTTSLAAPPRPAAVAGQRATLGGAGSAGHRRDPRLVEVEDADPELYEALRAWRARVAAEHGVPAYLVFHDRHLQMIAASRPRDLRELATCQGVGPTKLERYGDDVLDLVAAHIGA